MSIGLKNLNSKSLLLQLNSVWEKIRRKILDYFPQQWYTVTKFSVLAVCHGLREAVVYDKVPEKAGMKMSIFDRFVSKEAGEQKKNSLFPAPSKKVPSELDAAAAEAKAQYPDDSETVDSFVRVLIQSSKARRKKALEGEQKPMKAEAHFFLAEDRLSAYACVFPPENGGDGITLEEFLRDIHYEGITYGLLEEEIPQEFSRGYFHIFPVARGKLPQMGEDGKVTELFRRRKQMRLDVENGDQVDFREDVPLQPIRKGTVICLIYPPRPGTDGMDVTGLELPCPETVSAYIPQGKNIVLDKGGRALSAGVDGILYIENDLFCIHEQKIIDGDLSQFQGTLQISGNLYIGGNVDGGVDITASGDIVINGKIRRARVTSTCGTIRVQQGIYGTTDKTFLTAAGQIQSPVVEGAEIDTGTNVISEMISNSVIRCGGTVYAMAGRGMIVNSMIQAGDSILCVRIGNLSGGCCQFSIGYPPNIPESWEQITTELTQAQATIKKLWEPITILRKKGSHISDGEQSVLNQLVEQRELYLERVETLKTELNTVNQVLDKKSGSKIQCEKLYPQLEVRIGRLTEKITTVEENCNIHVVANSIHLT